MAYNSFYLTELILRIMKEKHFIKNFVVLYFYRDKMQLRRFAVNIV